MLADGGSGVGVDDERVRDFHFGQQDLVQLDGPPDVRLRVGPSSAREDVWWGLLMGRRDKGDMETV